MGGNGKGKVSREDLYIGTVFLFSRYDAHIRTKGNKMANINKSKADTFFGYLLGKSKTNTMGEIFVKTSQEEAAKVLGIRTASVKDIFDDLAASGKIRQTGKKGEWQLLTGDATQVSPLDDPYKFIADILSDTDDGSVWRMESFTLDKVKLSTAGKIVIKGHCPNLGDLERRIVLPKMLSVIKTPKRFYDMLTEWFFSCGESIPSMPQAEWDKGFRRAMMAICETQKLPHKYDALVRRDIVSFLRHYPVDEVKGLKQAIEEGADAWQATDTHLRYKLGGKEYVYTCARLDTFLDFSGRADKLNVRYDMTASQYIGLLEAILEDDLGVDMALMPWAEWQHGNRDKKIELVVMPPVDCVRLLGLGWLA